LFPANFGQKISFIHPNMPSRNSVGGNELRGLLAASERRAQVFNITKEEKENLKSQNRELERQVKAADRVTRVVATKKADAKSRQDARKQDEVEVSAGVVRPPKVMKMKKKPKRRPIIDKKAAKRRQEKRIQEALLKQQAEDEVALSAPTKVLDTEPVQQLTPTQSSSRINPLSQDSISGSLPLDDMAAEEVTSADHTQADSPLIVDNDGVITDEAEQSIDLQPAVDSVDSGTLLMDDESMTEQPSSPSIHAVKLDGEAGTDSDDKLPAKPTEVLLLDHSRDQVESESESEANVGDVLGGDPQDASDELLDHEMPDKPPITLTGSMAVISGLKTMTDTRDIKNPACTEDETADIAHKSTTSSDAGTSSPPADVQLNSWSYESHHHNTSSSPRITNMSPPQPSSKPHTVTTDAEKTLAIPLLTPDNVTQHKIRPALAALKSALTKVDFDVYLAAFNAWRRKGIDEELFGEAVEKVLVSAETKEMHQNVLEGIEWLELAVIAEDVEKALHVKA
jgi:hypothetical protein